MQSKSVLADPRPALVAHTITGTNMLVGELRTAHCSRTACLASRAATRQASTTGGADAASSHKSDVRTVALHIRWQGVPVGQISSRWRALGTSETASLVSRTQHDDRLVPHKTYRDYRFIQPVDQPGTLAAGSQDAP